MKRIKLAGEELATKEFVDISIAAAVAAGFKIEVVDELPTENISYKTIYFILHGTDEESNYYDEYVYTANNTWEKLGTTKTDLSGYYKKDEIDAINAGYVITKDNIQSEETLAYVNECIDRIENGKSYNLFIDYNYIKVPIYLYKIVNIGYDLVTNPIWDPSLTGVGLTHTCYVIRINGNIDSNTYRYTKITQFQQYNYNIGWGDNGSTIPMLTNRQSFMPYNTFHLANKDYVEQLDKYDWEKFNIRVFNSSNSVDYVIDDIVYAPISGSGGATYKYYKCIQDHKGSGNYRPHNSSSYWTELSEDELASMERYTQKEVYYIDISSDAKARADAEKLAPKIFKQIKEEGKVTLSIYGYKKSSYEFYIYPCSCIWIQDNRVCIIIEPAGQQGSTSSGYCGYYTKQTGLWINLYHTDLDFSYSSTMVMNRGALQDPKNLLSVENTKEFTPTGDYNPATKKYVDDIVGDINTILATLTTVEEPVEESEATE